MMMRPEGGPAWRLKAYEVIFEADTPAGKAFDVLLIAMILVSVMVVMLDSVEEIAATYRVPFRRAEWAFTALFTVEYVLRLFSVRRPSSYALSFFGVVDLLAVLPTYLSLLIPGGQYLIVIRILRVLRVFRVLKLAHYMGEAQVLIQALRQSRFKITVFLFTVMTVVVVVGALLYLIEGADAGFTSIPRSVYWAIVTLTTVGYGDIAPLTPVGQTLAAMVMILGYAIIAVPTGIITVELSQASRGKPTEMVCFGCGSRGHDSDARHCKQCGRRLEADAEA